MTKIDEAITEWFGARCPDALDEPGCPVCDAWAEYDRLRAIEAAAGELAGALQDVSDWKMPPSGVCYPTADGKGSDRPAPYDSAFAFGSEGGKKVIRDIARAALAAYREAAK